MKSSNTFALTLALALALVACGSFLRTTRAADEPAPPIIGTVVEDFTLPDTDGQTHTLASLKGKAGTVLIFMATRCPVSNGYNERMEKLTRDYAPRGGNVVGINPHSTEPIEEVKQHASDKGLTFTILKDKGNVIADRFDAQV